MVDIGSTIPDLIMVTTMNRHFVIINSRLIAINNHMESLSKKMEPIIGYLINTN